VLLLVGPAALVLLFFARPILTLWLGTEFAAEGALVLQILAFGMLINSLALIPQNLLQGIGRPDLTAKLQLVQLPFCIVVAWFLVTRFGLPGAAVAWALRVCLNFLLLIVAACWITRTSPRLLAGRELLWSVMALAALAVGLSALWGWGHTLLAHALFTVLLTVGFLVGAWRYVLDLEEKWHIRLWLRVAN
jgi:O-antigen/teichoic acid export membrane protein